MALITDPASYLSGTTDSAFGPKKGGGMIIDPFTAVLGVAGIGASLFGGQSAAKAQQEATAASIANQVAAANFGAQQQTNARALQAAQGLLGMQFGELIAAPRELERQKEAEKFKFGELRGMQRAGESEDWRRAMDRAMSGPAKEAARFANRQALKERLAASQGAMAGMFGPIAPINVDAMFAG